jgi:glyoxylase-like metal-dependent hydrolase (beta-lactamase superfamily II)
MCARGQERFDHGLAGGAINDYRSRFTWPDPLGDITVEMDVVDAPFQLQAATKDPWRGSVLWDCRYFGTTQQSGLTWPDSVATISYPGGAMWRMREHRVALEDHAALADLAPPDSARPTPPARTDTVAVTTALAPHVWAVDLPDAGTRSLALEFADHVVVLESSCDVPHGERLKAAVAGVTRKPVRYVSFSHHHPDYTGGLRPFIADTATVVCAGSNRAYVDEIAHWSFQLDPDRLWKRRPGGLNPLIDTLTAGRWRHADALNEVVAIDIGEKSHHTDAYLVFWLPRAKLLFEGDLGWFATDGGVRASSRAAGLLEAIDEAKLAPARLVQSWTPGATPHDVAMRDFRALVAARAGR